MRLTYQAGYEEVEEPDIKELLQSHGEPLSNEDLILFDAHRA